uniref:Uncharacterized protein n=1 Tax=Meloidogyne incognita TaxID=6306 RepID=A0A914KLE4_MELIC
MFLPKLTIEGVLGFNFKKSQKILKISILVILLLLCFINYSQARYKRFIKEENLKLINNEEYLIQTCVAYCDAQFGREFEEHFGRSYFTQFFDFPIDSLIVSSINNFNSFCSLVEQRSCCLQQECLKSSVPASPQTHICLEHRADFERALACLNSTVPHFKFHSICSTAAKQSVDIKRLADETHGFDIHLTEQYRQQDLRCRFQACTLSARIMLINEHCNQNGFEEDQREHARRTVRRYYEDDLELDLIEYGETLNATRRFPRFCAAFLAQQKAEPIALLIDHKSSQIYLDELNILLKIIGADTAKMIVTGM